MTTMPPLSTVNTVLAGLGGGLPLIWKSYCNRDLQKSTYKTDKKLAPKRSRRLPF